MNLAKVTEISSVLLGRECVFNEKIVGKIIAVDADDKQILIERYDDVGHTASDYDHLLSQGYEFLMDKHEFEECRKKSNLYYVHINEIDGIIVSDEYPKIIIEVDKSNKLSIVKK